MALTRSQKRKLKKQWLTRKKTEETMAGQEKNWKQTLENVHTDG